MGVLNIISPETLIKALVKKVLKRLTDYKKKKTGWLQGPYDLSGWDEELTAMKKYIKILQHQWDSARNYTISDNIILMRDKNI